MTKNSKNFLKKLANLCDQHRIVLKDSFHFAETNQENRTYRTTKVHRHEINYGEVGKVQRTRELSVVEEVYTDVVKRK